MKENRIEQLRYMLYKLIEQESYNMNKENVIKLSQKLDKLLNTEYNIKKKSNMCLVIKE